MNIISLIDENIASVNEYYNLSKTLYEEIINYMNSYKSHTLFYKQKIMNIQKEFDNKINNLKEKSDKNIYNEHLFEYINLFPNIIKKQIENYSSLCDNIEIFIKDFGALINQKVNLIKIQQTQYNDSKKNFLLKYQEAENAKSSFFNNLSITEETVIQYYTQKKIDKDDLIFQKNPELDSINSINNSDKIKKLEDKMLSIIQETKVMEKNYLGFIESSKVIKQNVKENAEKTANIIHLGLNDISSKYQNDIIKIISTIKMCFQEPLSILNNYINMICSFNTKKELEELYQNFCNKSVTSSNIFPSKYKLKTIGLINNTNNENIFAKDIFDNEDDLEKDDKDDKEVISEINLLTIKMMYNNFSLLSAHKLDIKSEEEKLQTKKLSNKLFLVIKESDNDQKKKINISEIVFSQNDLTDLEKLLEKKLNRFIFLQRLSRFRALKYDLSLKYFVLIGNILNNLLSKVIEDNDLATAKNCIILSQTFFCEYQKEKIYLKIYIQNNEIFKSKKFWEDLLDKLIKENEQHSNMKENIFGNIYTLINNMFEFSLSENEIKDIIEPKIKKYNFNKNYIKDINDLIKIKSESGNQFDDNRKYEKYIGEIKENYNKEINEEIKKEKQDKINNDIKEEKQIMKNTKYKISKTFNRKVPVKMNFNKAQSIWDMDEDF